MDNRILVAYASKYGATAEIAEKIGRVLRQSGLPADVTAVDRVKEPASYDAVILGSAVYVGQWRKEAAEFVKANETLLSQRKVWIFSSGPSGKGGPVKLVEGWRMPESLRPVVKRIRPRDVAVFHGNVNLEKMSLIEKWMIRYVKALPGDFRDWNKITAWAASIADSLGKSS